MHRSVWNHSFCFHPAAAADVYTLSLHDALPISGLPVSQDRLSWGRWRAAPAGAGAGPARHRRSEEHTSEPSHITISYAVFCLKKKKNKNSTPHDMAAYTVPAQAAITQYIHSEIQ